MKTSFIEIQALKNRHNLAVFISILEIYVKPIRFWCHGFGGLRVT